MNASNTASRDPRDPGTATPASDGDGHPHKPSATRLEYPAAEHAYWRSRFRHEPYYLQAYGYSDYAPAYLTGYLGHGRIAGRRFEEFESALERDYADKRGRSALTWIEARPAARAAWARVEGTLSPAPE